MHCLVTGAGGYIGRALLPVLAAQGVSLSGQCRPGSDLVLPDSVTRPLECDFSSGAADLSLKGVDLVFHLAGIAHQRADSHAYQQVNVNATLTLAEKAAAAGVKRFVFLSSVKATTAQYGSQGELLPVTHSRNPYAQSKALAESGLQAICRESELELVIVRPALVYGEHARGHLRWLRRWVAWHMPAPPPGGGRSMISLDDLVQLLALLRVAPLTSPLHITVTDNESYSTRRLHSALCTALDRRPWLPSPPDAVWQSLCQLWDTLRREERGGTWARMTADERYCNVGMESLDFRPSLSFEDSLGHKSHAV